MLERIDLWHYTFLLLWIIFTFIFGVKTSFSTLEQIRSRYPENGSIYDKIFGNDLRKKWNLVAQKVLGFFCLAMSIIYFFFWCKWLIEDLAINGYLH